MLVSPVAADDMRSWDRVEPEKRSRPSPGTIAKDAIVPDRPWCKPGKKAAVPTPPSRPISSVATSDYRNQNSKSVFSTPGLPDGADNLGMIIVTVTVLIAVLDFSLVL
ncbi:hypothetical protein [Lactiplantibacillus paraxiangfangensis]|uniref:hypothetical protein n=1 Tax=Lactiplantibacillus paraxiangfangensis TaxID=3076224 RepID=UPI0030C6BCD2